MFDDIDIATPNMQPTPPSWAVGRFYGVNPANGAQIVLTITATGQVTASSLGATSYGTWNGGFIEMEGVMVAAEQVSGGLRTVRAGQAVTYLSTPVNTLPVNPPAPQIIGQPPVSQITGQPIILPARPLRQVAAPPPGFQIDTKMLLIGAAAIGLIIFLRK